MRAKNGSRTDGHFFHFLDEDGASFPQFFDDMLVMHDFFPDVNRRAIKIERDFHHVNGANHSGTKPTRLEKVYFLSWTGIRGDRLKRHRNLAERS